MRFGRDTGADPVLITEAATSLTEQHETRKRRYIITMAIRAVCLVLATVFYQTPLVMGAFAILAIVLPWIAVMTANDRPPKKSLYPNRMSGREDVSPLPTAAPRAAITPTRVIEADD